MVEASEMDSRVSAVIDLMRESLADRLSIRTLSRRVNLSAPRLRQLFKRQTGVSPSSYLRQLRMNTAVQLLTSSYLSIKEISFRSGAGDTSHFVRDFRKQYGLTPGEFRARTRQHPRTSVSE
jgi:transcriptional regulator GlxA family with amidase domain